MNTRKSKSIIWLIPALVLVFSSQIHAQTSLTLPTTGTGGSGSTAVDFELRLDGSLYAKGSGTSTLANSDLQASHRFLWYPALSAFRTGVGTSYETTNSIGADSVAMGYQCLASGSASTAMGYAALASGSSSVAMGYYSNATGSNSVALGWGFATGASSAAIGSLVTASGVSSFALGNSATATGNSSFALGDSVTATAYASTALGVSNTANSADSVVIGSFNLGLSESGTTPSATTWVTSDPLFEVGNGTSFSAKSDAIVVYKDGTSTFQGTITASAGVLTTSASVAQTDIPMFTGN